MPAPDQHQQLADAGFSHVAAVFGIPPAGNDGVSGKVLRKFAAILASNLDNDRDGLADNPGVVYALLEKDTAAAISRSFSEYKQVDEEDGSWDIRSYERVIMNGEERFIEDRNAANEEILCLVT